MLFSLVVASIARVVRFFASVGLMIDERAVGSRQIATKVEGWHRVCSERGYSCLVNQSPREPSPASTHTRKESSRAMADVDALPEVSAQFLVMRLPVCSPVRKDVT